MAWWWPKFQVEISCHINNTVIPNHKMIYYSCFHTVMTYGLLFWGLSSDSMKIFILQKKIIRIIMGCRSSDSFRKLLFNPLNTKLNPICHLLALGAHHFLHISRIRVKITSCRYVVGRPDVWWWFCGWRVLVLVPTPPACVLLIFHLT